MLDLHNASFQIALLGWDLGAMNPVGDPEPFPETSDGSSRLHVTLVGDGPGTFS